MTVYRVFITLLIACIGGLLSSCARFEPAPQLPADWIPYVTDSKHDFGKIGIVSTETGESRLLVTEHLGRAPQLSSDRTRIVFGQLSQNALTKLEEGQLPHSNEIELQVIDLDGATVWSHAASMVGHQNIQWDPTSGDRLAWLEGVSTLHIATLATDEKQTFSWNQIENFAWHPSGGFITVVLEDGLYDVALTTGNITPRLLLADLPQKTTVRHLDWFHHSEHFLFTVRREIECETNNFFDCTLHELWIDGDEMPSPQRIAENATVANIAPDDRSVAFSNGIPWISVCHIAFELGIMQLDENFLTTAVISDWQIPPVAETGLGFYPVYLEHGIWLPNKTFAAQADARCSPTKTAHGTYLFDAQTSVVTQLTNPIQSFDPRQASLADKILAAGGNPEQQIVFVNKSDNSLYSGDLVVMNALGENYRSLFGASLIQDAVPSPDGAYVAYRESIGTVSNIDERQNDYALWIIEVETGERRVITSGGGYRTLPSWSPDGAWLTYGENATLVEHNLADDTRIVTDRAVITPAYSNDGMSLWYATLDDRLIRVDRQTNEIQEIGSLSKYDDSQRREFYAVPSSAFQTTIFEYYKTPEYTPDDFIFPTFNYAPYIQPKNTRYPTVGLYDVEQPLTTLLTSNRGGVGGAFLIGDVGISDTGCTSNNSLFYHAMNFKYSNSTSYAELSSTDIDLSQMSISQDIPIQPLSDRAALIYLEHPCVDAADSKQGWYFFDFVTKQVDLVRLD